MSLEPKLDRCLEELTLLDVAQEELHGVAELIRRQRAQLRELRSRLLDVPLSAVESTEAAAGQRTAEQRTVEPRTASKSPSAAVESWSSGTPLDAQLEELTLELEDVVASSAGSIAAVRRVSSCVREVSRRLRRELSQLDLAHDDERPELLWLQVGGGAYGLPARFVGGLSLRGASGAEVPAAVCLGELLGLEDVQRAESQVELQVPGFDPVTIAVERVGAVGQARVYPIPEIVRRSGPFEGAVRGPEDSLRLVLDARAIVLRARAGSAGAASRA